MNYVEITYCQESEICLWRLTDTARLLAVLLLQPCAKRGVGVRAVSMDWSIMIVLNSLRNSTRDTCRYGPWWKLRGVTKDFGRGE